MAKNFDGWFKDFNTWGLSKDELIQCSQTPGNGPGDAVFTSESGSVMTRSICERWLAFHSAASAGWNAAIAASK